MDPNHRHELEENDLAVFLANSKKWWGKYGTLLLLAVLVVLGSYLGYNWYTARVTKTQDDAKNQLAEATSPDVCFKLAKQYNDVAYQAQAYLKGAELAAPKAWQVDPAGSPSFSETDRQSSMKEAETGYQGVLGLDGADLVFKLNAHLGLGRVAENRHQWEAARKEYQQVEQAAGDKYPAIAAQARALMGKSTELASPVAFGPEPVAPPAQAPFLLTPLPSSSQPTSMPALPPFMAPSAETRPAGVLSEATSRPTTPAVP